MEDAEAVLTAIRSTPPDVPIDLVLHTPGGLVLAAEQIARAVYNHPAKTTVIIPHYAMSGGTLIALAADEIIMDKHAVIGPLDPQINNMPAASIVRAVREKGVQAVDDETLILADISEKALEQVKQTVKQLLKKHMDDEKAEEVADLLCEGHFTHDNPIFPEQARELNLNINTDMPPEVFDLLMLYPQPAASQRSVSYTRGESKTDVPTIRYK
jgi:ClpP class serine protease